MNSTDIERLIAQKTAVGVMKISADGIRKRRTEYHERLQREQRGLRGQVEDARRAGLTEDEINAIIGDTLD